MSTPPIVPSAVPPEEAPEPRPAKRGHPVLWLVAGAFLFVALLIGGAAWYSTTAGFQARVLRQVVATLEKATGGRVELASIHWRLMHVEIEADNLTIHGLEGPSEVPYAHIDRLFVRAKIISLFRAKVGLNYLGADRPVVHLIVYPDGSTNQPRPKTQSSNKSGIDTFFDLAIDRAEIGHGEAILNDRVIPFDLSANDVGLTLSYNAARDHYLASLRVADLTAQRGRSPMLRSNLGVQVDMGRNTVNISSLQLQSGADKLQANATIDNFNDPRFTVHALGTVDVRTVESMTAIPGLKGGVIDLSLEGHGSMHKFAVTGLAKVTNAAYQMPGVDLSGVDASTAISITDQEIALTQLKARLQPGGTATGELHIVNWMPASANAPAPAAPPAKASLASRLHLPSRKSRKAAAKPVIAAAPVPLEKGTIRAEIHDVTLATVMRIVATPRYQDLGFDTAAGGQVAVDWVGSAADLTTKAFVHLTPPTPPTPAQVPLTGLVDAEYFNRGGKVEIKQLDAQTPGTRIHVQGSLGVHPVGQSSALQAELTTSNLGEFDRTLIALGLTANGKSGVKAIPVLLHGPAEFHGTVTGTIINPDVKGHLTASNFDTTFFAAPGAVPVPGSAPGAGARSAATALASAPAGGSTISNTVPSVAKSPASAASASATPTGPVVTPASVTATSPTVSPINPPTTAAGLEDIHWDHLDADAEYSPLAIAVGRATLTRGATVIHAEGQLRPHIVSAKKSTFDEYSPLTAQLNIQKLSLADLAVMAGSSVPVTGTANLQAHVSGTLGNLSGGGTLAVQGGAIYGEPYHSLNAQLRFAGQEIGASNLTFLQNGGKLTGEGGYDLRSKAFHFNAEGTGFDLAHIQKLQTARAAVGGNLTFDARGSGTVARPIVSADVHLKNLTIAGQQAGSIEANVRTANNTLYLTVASTLQSASLRADAQIELSGDYATTGHLALTQFDLTPFLKSYNVTAVTNQSMVNANATVQGPLKRPRAMSGDLTMNQFSLTLAGVPLQSDGAVHVRLNDGVVHLDPVHITGDDTNLRAQGSVDIFQPTHDLDVHANGNINLKLAETINPDVTSSGHVDFTVDAAGSIEKPDLKGQVKFTNVAVSLEDIPNGLSQMNGTLVFDQDRLEVQNLTAMSGGGQLKVAGYLTYQHGIYGDLTATGKNVRVRYQGLTSVADAKLHLQGAEDSLLLSGNILITRFTINPDLDLAGLTSSSGSVSAPLDSSAPSNHVRLDIHITSSPELDFQNSYAKLAGDVDLRIGGTVATPSVLGRISVTDGSATFAGTQYQLQRGDIYFTNPVTIDPVIDLDATAHVEDYDITIGLHGTPSKLSFTYRSEPPLPQGDIFALLALGRTQEEQQIYSNEQQQAGVSSSADALLGGALNATVSSRIQKLFGGGSVKIDPTFVGTLGNSTARITVEQQISKNATLTYATNVNSTAEQLIQAQIDLTRNISIVALRDESGVFSLLIKFRQRAR